MSGWGGKKFLRPRIMNDPVGRYSPLGADFDTCWHSQYTLNNTATDGLACPCCHAISRSLGIQSPTLVLPHGSPQDG